MSEFIYHIQGDSGHLEAPADTSFPSFATMDTSQPIETTVPETKPQHNLLSDPAVVGVIALMSIGAAVAFRFRDRFTK